ncbi:MAG: DUF5680 domain-containing protein [bacterium]|nr:DUF5680 domain-containing protein [bacterium]
MPIQAFEVHDLFCEAMLAGWVSGAEPEVLPQFPGFKCYQYEKGSFTLIDMFCSSRLHVSFGQTIVWFADQPVWMMNYSGQYPNRAIPFLKDVLQIAYSTGNTLGGRGAAYISGDDYVYFNHNPAGTNFADSYGTEYIFEKTDADDFTRMQACEIGHHHYRCLLL